MSAPTFITLDPSGPFSKFTVLPAQIYQWTAPAGGVPQRLLAASLTLLLMLIVMNSVAVYLRNRYSSQRM